MKGIVCALEIGQSAKLTFICDFYWFYVCCLTKICNFVPQQLQLSKYYVSNLHISCMKKINCILAAGAIATAAMTAAGQSLVVGQDFEGPDFPPQGWVTIDSDGDGSGWVAQSGASYVTQYSGSRQLAVSYTRDPASYSAKTAQDNWLVSPAFEVTNRQFVLQFVYAAQDLEHTEPVSVLVSEGGAEVGDFVELWSTTADNGYDDDIVWSTATHSLKNYEGKTIRVAVRHKASSTYGLSIDNFYILNQAGPLQPAGFAVKAATDGKKEITLSWTNPAKTATGDDLTDLTVVVYRDGEKVTELSGRTPGAADSYVDITTDGTHSYAIAAKNSEGEGLKTSTRSVFLGEDVAKAISDLTALTLADGTVQLSWTSPTKGVNNGYINALTMTYKVYRNDVGIASGISEAKYTDSEPAQGLNTYKVTAVTGGGESAVDYTSSAYIADASKIDVVIGATAVRDNALNRLPIDITTKYSVSQSIYFPEDFGFLTGEIGEIVYKGFHGTSTPLVTNARIYITPTTLDELEDWAAVAEADKVFEGEFSLAAGVNDVVFKLTSPYNYTGGKVVVTVVKDEPNSGGYTDRFYSVVTDKPNRTFTTSTYSAVDISALPHSSYGDKKTAELPSTRFVLTPKGLASLSGKVTTGADNTPVAGATVAADGFDGLFATTDADGLYTFKYIPAQVTSVTVSKVGYEDKVLAVALTDGGTATADANLVRYANFTLSGKVTTADTGLNAAGAVVSVAGYEELSTTVGNDGAWTLPGIYVGKDYTLAVKYPLYDVYTDEFSYTDEGDRQFKDIVLDRALIPAWNVEAVVSEDGYNTRLTWNDPTSRDVVPGMKSIGEVSEMRYTGGDYYSTVYNIAHAYSEAELAAQKMVGMVVTAERVYIKATAGTFTAKVWRGTREDHIEVASQVIPESAISPDGAWVTVEFENPAEIKPGAPYMIGVEADNASSSPFGEAAGSCISGANNVKWGESPYSSNGYSPWCIQTFCAVPGTDVEIAANDDAPKCAYNVYLGLKGDDGISWSKLTSTPVGDCSYTDNTWPTQVAGEYVYGVSAVYNKVGESVKALSDNILRAVDTDVAVTAFVSPVKSVERQGDVTVTVTVTNYGELPVENIPVALTLNGAESVKATYTGTLKKGESDNLTLGDITLADGLNVLQATASVDGDQVSANDVLVFELPNFENIALVGYRWDAYGNAGFTEFGSNNPEGASFKKEITPNDALIIAGECVNGTFFGFTATWWGESHEFVEIDSDALVVERNIENTEDYVLDMAYDYSSDVMYCLATDFDTTFLGTVDLSNGVVEFAAPLSHVMRALACSLAGKLYAIDQDGVFYSLDPATGKSDIIGSTGVGNVAYLQSMAFDHNTERLFWAHTNAAVSGDLYEIAPATGEATRLGSVLFNGTDQSEIVGLYSRYTAPAKSFAALGISPADGEEMSRFDGFTVTYAAPVTADRSVLQTIAFSVPVEGWSVESDASETVHVVPVDDSLEALVIDFEPDKTYTLTIPEGAFVKANGDYSEAITITMVSNATGLDNVAADCDEDVRYFNLQGVEIANPQGGNVYIIRRSDGTATKQLIK